MSKNPDFNYTITAEEAHAMARDWFKKKYPDLSKISEDEFEVAAFGIFDICKNLIGTESKEEKKGPGFGGSHGEIRCAIAAAMGIAIEFDPEEVRHFNNATIFALATSWRLNDHFGFLSRCASYERSATNHKGDLLPLAREIEGFYEMSEPDEHEEVEVHIDPVVKTYVEILGEMTPNKRYITGNRYRRRICKKPPTRQQKLLNFDVKEG